MSANIIYPNVSNVNNKYLCRTNVKNIITPDSLQDIKNFANNLKLPRLKCFNLLNNEHKNICQKYSAEDNNTLLNLKNKIKKNRRKNIIIEIS